MSFPLSTLNLEALFVAETKLSERKLDLRGSSFYFPGALWCKCNIYSGTYLKKYLIPDLKYNFHNTVFPSEQLLWKQKRYAVITNREVVCMGEDVLK